MIYLDYSATTPVNESVLFSFNALNLEFIGNANSNHLLGINANNLINGATKQIKNLLKIDNCDVIYTSSSSEANNLALKGICLKYQNRGKHIITTKFEHSSINEVLKYLETIGFSVSYVESDSNGLINIDNLKSLLREDTILVTINHINSEIGIKQNIEEIGELLKNYSKCFFHVDMTQSIGKVSTNLENVDLFSFSAHKIYGLKGIAALVKKKKIMLEPLIHGGNSTTIYRSGTPAHPLIAALAKALRLSITDLDKNYQYVQKLNLYLQDKLKEITGIFINSNEYCIPHILNISVSGVKSETLMRALSDEGIFVSTKSACSDENSYSESVYNLTHDLERSKESIRISLSYLTTYEELNKFIETLKEILTKLR